MRARRYGNVISASTVVLRLATAPCSTEMAPFCGVTAGTESGQSFARIGLSESAAGSRGHRVLSGDDDADAEAAGLLHEADEWALGGRGHVS
jgi:hypothetical protein